MSKILKKWAILATVFVAGVLTIACQSLTKEERKQLDKLAVQAEEYYESTYGKIMELLPGIKGMILVGESCEFRSRDPHTNGRMRLDPVTPEEAERTKELSLPGWWPCTDYPLLLNMIKKETECT